MRTVLAGADMRCARGSRELSPRGAVRVVNPKVPGVGYPGGAGEVRSFGHRATPNRSGSHATAPGQTPGRPREGLGLQPMLVGRGRIGTRSRGEGFTDQGSPPAQPTHAADLPAGTAAAPRAAASLRFPRHRAGLQKPARPRRAAPRAPGRTGSGSLRASCSTIGRNSRTSSGSNCEPDSRRSSSGRRRPCRAAGTAGRG